MKIFLIALLVSGGWAAPTPEADPYLFYHHPLLTPLVKPAEGEEVAKPATLPLVYPYAHYPYAHYPLAPVTYTVPVVPAKAGTVQVTSTAGAAGATITQDVVPGVGLTGYYHPQALPHTVYRAESAGGVVHEVKIAKRDADAEPEPAAAADADADPWLLYGHGLGYHYGGLGYGYAHAPYHLPLVTVKAAEPAEEEAEAEEEAVKPVVYTLPYHYGYGLGYGGLGYGGGYYGHAYGHGLGYGYRHAYGYYGK